MITAGESYYSLKYKAQENMDNNIDIVSYDKYGGLGIFTLGLYLDTHFSCRGRDGRLIGLIFDLME